MSTLVFSKKESRVKYLIVDWLNLVKRYTYSRDISSLDEAELVTGLTVSLINRITDLVSELKPNLIYICSDNGYNRRATAILSGYKSGRKRFKSLTNEEKEKSYVEYLKKVAYTLPFPFIDVKNTEADLIVYVLTRYLRRLDDKARFIVASSDSDFVQLLGEDTVIFDWYKGEVTVDNWCSKYKLDACFSHRNYALAKSIVGDKSDSVSGLYNWGWKKVSRVFNVIDSVYGDKATVSSVGELEKSVSSILDNYADGLSSRDKKLLENFKTVLSDSGNKRLIQSNQSVIDLSNLESPFIYRVNSAIERETFERKLKYDQKELYKLLRLDIYKGNDLEYTQILRKNAKSAAVLVYFSHKINEAVKLLSKRRVVS